MVDTPEQVQEPVEAVDAVQPIADTELMVQLKRLDEVYNKTVIRIELRMADGVTREVQILRARMSHIAPVVSFMSGLTGAIGKHTGAAPTGMQGFTVNLRSMESMAGLLRVVGEHTEAVRTLALLLSVGLTADEYDALDMDQGLYLIGSIMRVNNRFFTEQVLPLFHQINAGWVVGKNAKRS